MNSTRKPSKFFSRVWAPIKAYPVVPGFIGHGTYHGLRRQHIDTYLNGLVFRYNRRIYRHVSFETALGLAPHRSPESYWDITGQPNPRKQAAPARRNPRRRKTASGMCQDRAKPVDVDKV